jgi:large subunit ribosomal protein L24
MTLQKFKIKKGDTVQVVTGKDRGHRGVVKQVLREKKKVLIDGVNVVVRNTKPDYQHPSGGYKKEMPVDISNVSLVDPSTNKPGKIGFRVEESGTKVRYFRKSGVVV